MDTKLIRKGTTLYLPVFVEGGLLALGDLHAVMGDGEICVSACEVPGKVTVRVSIVKGMAPPYPVLETEDSVYIIVSHGDLWDAIKQATELGVEVLQKALGLSWEEAYMLGSLILDVEISQLVDPKKTVRIRIPKEYVSAKEVLNALSLE
ncbi:Acetamidase [Thermococcus sp. 2319x1]|nr:acetamidase/formamidase family protein [Thermococcus sp. 2319x1]ALV62513.1 Acetamidase [Thermococcus sp. 2319x1]